jgi:hypothetical protein
LLYENIEISEGQKIYVKFVTFDTNTNFASTTLTYKQKTIHLIVKDTNSREDRQDHQVNVKKPLSRWELMKLKIENFFAELK